MQASLASTPARGCAAGGDGRIAQLGERYHDTVEAARSNRAVTTGKEKVMAETESQRIARADRSARQAATRKTEDKKAREDATASETDPRNIAARAALWGSRGKP